MKFIDSFDSGAVNQFTDLHDGARNSSDYDQMISDALTQISLLEEMVDSIQNHIGKLTTSEAYKSRDTDLLKDERILATILSFLRGNGFLLLLEADFFTALKYMNTTKNDWEYRFFARRIYTLMYETHTNFSASFGDMYKGIGDWVSENAISNFKKNLKALNRCVEVNAEVLKEVRNSGEAHKDKDIERQIRAIESMSIKESSKLIETFSGIMIMTAVSLLAIFSELKKHLEGLSGNI